MTESYWTKDVEQQSLMELGGSQIVWRLEEQEQVERPEGPT
jgi:hypothetical protein